MQNAHYVIERDGHRYFGNVWLKDFHIFEQDGESYLFNVENLTPYRVTDKVARLVNRVSRSFGNGLLSGQDMEEINKFELVAGASGLPASAGTAAEDGAKPPDGKAAHHAVSNISLFVAQACNMACVYCYGQGGEYASKGMMSADVAFRAVDWLMDSSGDSESVNIGFFGGEPMMNFPLIKKVVRYAKWQAEKHGKKVTFGMTTNASLLTDSRIAYLKEEDIVPMVSFDGTAELQDRQRPFNNGKGSHGKVFANIRKLQKVFPQVMARATLYGDADPAKVRAGMEEAGIRAFSMVKAAPVILDGPVNADLLEQQRVQERIISMEIGWGKDMLRDIKARNVADGMKNSKLGFFIWQMIAANKRHYYCGVGRGMAAITANGDIYPCHRFAGQDDMKMGNIETYQAGGINDYHRTIVNNLPECKRCWARFVCGGGCFYEGKAARGDIRLPDPAHCMEVKALMEAAIPIYLQLDEEDKTYIKGKLKTRLEDQIP
jgi:uncharacterized protein